MFQNLLNELNGLVPCVIYISYLFERYLSVKCCISLPLYKNVIHNLFQATDTFETRTLSLPRKNKIDIFAQNLAFSFWTPLNSPVF